MNKDEFLKKVNDLDYYNHHSYTGGNDSERRGFEECKREVLKLIPELDIQGMNPKSFELFSQAMKDLSDNYNNMFALQKELQIKNQQYIELQNIMVKEYKRKQKEQ